MAGPLDPRDPLAALNKGGTNLGKGIFLALSGDKSTEALRTLKDRETGKFTQSGATPHPIKRHEGEYSDLGADPVAEEVDFRPLKNLLDAYDQVTYHFELYMIDEVSLIRQKYNNPHQKITIAESGVTGDILIQNVKITTYPGPMAVTQNKTSTNFDITVVQPLGSSLIDNIYAASLKLGIKNYTESMYFLELSFRGRDPKTSKPTEMTNINKKRIIWPIKITAIKAMIDTGGTTYDINGFLYSNLGFSNEHMGALPKAITLVNKTLISGAFMELEADINKEMRRRAGESMVIPDQIMIVLDPAFANYTVSTGKPVNTSRNSETPNHDKGKTISIPKNYKLLQAINAIMVSSSQYMKKLRNVNEVSDTDSENRKYKFKQFHRVSTFAQLTGFDPLRNTYVRRFVFVVSPFDTMNLYDNPLDAKADAALKFRELKSKGAIQKHYNYIYTGKNDQVIEFNMEFNFGWYVKRPPHGGYTTVDQAAEGKLFSRRRVLERRDDLNNLIAKIRATAQAVDDPDAPVTLSQASFDKLFKFDINSIMQRGGSGILSHLATTDTGEESDERKLVTRMYLGKLYSMIEPDIASPTGLRLNLGDNTTVNITIEQRDYLITVLGPRLQSANKDLGNLFLPSAPSGPNHPRAFVTDFDPDKTEATLGASITPISFAITDWDDQQLDGDIQDALIELEKESGSAYSTSLFGQAFGGAGGDMVEIKLTIKGDPFWIETAPLYDALSKHSEEPLPTHTDALRNKIVEILLETKVQPGVILPDDERVSSTYKQNYMMFTINTPMVANIGSGIIERRTDAHNGLYSVNKVESDFADGKFTQQLTCYRDVAVNLRDLK